MENKEKKKTKIDIILPNYNSSQFIVKTVNSILKQRNLCAPPAPSHGLFLEKIIY